MTRNAKLAYWHKRQGKGADLSATARHSSLKDGKALPNPLTRVTGAEEFLRKLQIEIRRSV